MDPLIVRRSFVAFHLVLGFGLLAGSVQTLIHATAPENWYSHQHLAFVAAAEGLGAVLFLFPRTLRIGAMLLVTMIGLAFVLHAVQGDWRPDLAIYAAGVWFVFAHGSGWEAQAGSRGVAA